MQSTMKERHLGMFYLVDSNKVSEVAPQKLNVIYLRLYFKADMLAAHARCHTCHHPLDHYQEVLNSVREALKCASVKWDI